MDFCSLTGWRHVLLLGNIYKVIFFLHNVAPEKISLLYKTILSLVIKDYAKGKHPLGCQRGRNAAKINADYAPSCFVSLK